MLLLSVTVQQLREKAFRKHGVLRVRFILFFFLLVVPSIKVNPGILGKGVWFGEGGNMGKGTFKGWDTQLFKTTTCHFEVLSSSSMSDFLGNFFVYFIFWLWG